MNKLTNGVGELVVGKSTYWQNGGWDLLNSEITINVAEVRFFPQTSI